MRALIGTTLLMLPFLGEGSPQGDSAATGSIRGNAFRKDADGEPAVLPGVPILIHERITKETELWLKAMDFAFSRKMYPHA